MNRIRRRVIILFIWLIGFFSLEGMFELHDIDGIPYPMIIGAMISSLLAIRLTRALFWVLLIAPLSVFYLIIIWMQVTPDAFAIRLSILEIGGILITALLCHQLGLAINEYEIAVARISVGHCKRFAEDASQDAGVLYREVRRSRNHQRPLALLAIKIDEASLQLNVDRLLLETQKAMTKQYALMSILRLLGDRLEDCDTVFLKGDQFLVLLPEVKPADLPCVIERLCRESLEKIGVELKIGAASLPDDSFTLEGLVDRATRAMNMVRVQEITLDLKKAPAYKLTHWSRLISHIGTHSESSTD